MKNLCSLLKIDYLNIVMDYYEIKSGTDARNCSVIQIPLLTLTFSQHYANYHK